MKHLIKFKIFESVQSYDFTYEGQEGTSWVYLLKDEFENQFKVEISRRP